ncbi:sterol desaturase family protein [Undibacterium sp.]|jgi:alkylglycerol monooxygenase|uniref:sterol desaturase family protein n=1 Tax=Undibacterium sp. TaxID=1914977 RepID=UPI002B66B19A|nr:sterol desaturase family protein [Undibacterium sp.]HTD03215.1 sterol desaturase family protein [Undibacterium sp.]
MQEKIITLASPVFFLLIAIELIVGIKRRRYTYRVSDTLNSLSLGVMSQIVGVFLKVLAVGIYAWVYAHWSLFKLPAGSVWVWVSGLLLYDFMYYWLHRMGHETAVLWAAHVVHHQSEEYNLSTALRQTSTGSLLGWIFYLPLALLGYPVEVFIVIALIDLLYQFWVHTQQIGKLGWFDHVFVSPSNHRVHHAVNDIYLDKNYGGILILWDRLFGTFIDEMDEHPVVYGTRSPLRSWNPLWANLEVYKAVALDAWRARRWIDKLQIWFRPPGWRPADVAAAYPSPAFDIHRPRYDPPLSGARMWYCLVQFVLILQVTTHFLNAYKDVSLTAGLAYAVWLVAGLWIVGGLMEQRRPYLQLEIGRLLATLLLVVLSGSWFTAIALPLIAQAVIGLICIASLCAVWSIFKHRNHYGHPVH